MQFSLKLTCAYKHSNANSTVYVVHNFPNRDWNLRQCLMLTHHTIHVASVSAPDPHSQSSTAICGRQRGERASRAHSLPDSKVNIQL